MQEICSSANAGSNWLRSGPLPSLSPWHFGYPVAVTSYRCRTLLSARATTGLIMIISFKQRLSLPCSFGPSFESLPLSAQGTDVRPLPTAFAPSRSLSPAPNSPTDDTQFPCSHSFELSGPRAPLSSQAVKLKDDLATQLKNGQSVLPPFETFTPIPWSALSPELNNALQPALQSSNNISANRDFRSKKADR